MHSDNDLKDVPSLVVTAFRQFTTLMQDEIALARSEISRNLSRAGTGLGMIGVAALLALTALNVLATAVVGYLAQLDMSAGTAALIVGAVLLMLALILVMMGKSRLSADALDPKVTRAQIKRDIATIKEATHG